MNRLNTILAFCLLITPTFQQTLFDGFVKFIDEGEAQVLLEPPEPPSLQLEYDFIIVGAGIAGCVLANRLSENPQWKILLIEAGPSENYFADVPGLVHYIQFSRINWKYKTVPSNRFCLAMENHQCHWPRGKVVGGSSVLNYMIYTRGNKQDYDNWAKLGNKGWSYEEVLPYFRKVENFTIPEFADSTYHGTNGYLNVGFTPYKSPLTDNILEAIKQNNIEYVDYNGPTQIGASRIQTMIKDGRRESAGRAYLIPINYRRNLYLKKMATVSKVLIAPKTRTAYGVELYTNGRKFVAKATKEVILSAGAIGSPQLLMLSGIGPKKHLKDKGIRVLANLNVGYNLMDHIALGLTFIISDQLTYSLDSLLTVENMKQFYNYGKGPITVPGGYEVMLFHNFKNSTNVEYPDIELFFVTGSLASDETLKKSFAIQDSIYDSVFKPIQKFSTFSAWPMLMKPKSRGRILLRDSNYKSKPDIFPNYLAHDEDVNTIIKGVYLVLNITKQPALKKIGARLHNISIPGCQNFKFGTQDYFKCLLRHFTFTIYHYSGTCKMGPATDKTAVVDPRLRVYGIKGLRVIDASIIPEIPAGHTSAPAYMIAEKGADMIKEDWSSMT